MKYIIVFALSFLCLSANAAIIDCYSGNQHIYHGEGKNIVYNDVYIMFTEKHSKDILAVTADCKIRIKHGRYS